MPNLQDWLDYRAKHPDVYGARPQMDPRQVADLTTKAQMLVSHPGWQMFLDRLASRRSVLLANRSHLERSILDGDGGEDAALKLRLRDVKGELAGLEFASGIVPEMLTAGEAMLQRVPVQDVPPTRGATEATHG